MMCLAIVFSLTSCGIKELSQNTGEVSPENEASEIGTAEELTAEENEKTQPETVTAKETKKSTKIYLDATDKDFEDLTDFLEFACYYFCWPDNFDREKGSFANDIRALLVMIDMLSGTEEYDFGGKIPKDFHGVIEYNYYSVYEDPEPRIKLYRENRSSFDPLFRFKDYDDSSKLYYSVDAETVEWVETELFGGKPDRDNLVEYTTEDYDHYCYYCDGRYYFQIDIRTGSGPIFDNYNNKQLEDGRYTLSFQLFGSDGNATAGLIEKDGNHYWKIFSVNWSKSS